MEISCWIQGHNEAHNLPKLFASLKDFSDIVFVDHESTDDTVKVAKSLGARVFTRKFLKEKVKKDDVSDFTNRFGYTPRFKAGEMMPQANKEREECQKFCKNDWVLNMDCDEILTWNDKEIKKILPLYDVVNCKYYHIRDDNGGRTDWFQTLRLYNRKKTFWIGRIHEVINGYNLRTGWTNDMEIDHFQVVGRNRSGNINALEFSVLKDLDIRAFYYLGKEYHHHGIWDKTIIILELYLKESWYVAEKVKAYMMIADSMYNLGRPDEAWVYATQAIKLNPMSKEAFLLLGKIAPISDRAMWEKHAEVSFDDHLL